MDGRLAFLTNYIAPYRIPVLQRLALRCKHLRILISTPMESNRPWIPDWRNLDVVVQRTFTFRAQWRHPRGFRERLFLHFPLDTLRQLRKFAPDVVISSEMGVRSLLAVCYRKMRSRSRLIVWADISEYTEGGRGWMRSIIRRFIAKNGDGFIVNGESGARYLASLGISEVRVFRIPSTVDVARFAQHDLCRDERTARCLLYVGRLIERKGLLQFTNVLCNWAVDNPGREVEFVIVGDGPIRKKLGSITTPPNLTIRLLRSVPYDGLPRIYAEAGILALPTLADTWGIVVNEAMAAGLPVLGSTYSQAVEELVRDRHNGWTFRPDHDHEMYAAIGRFFNTSLRELDTMRRHARATALRLTPEYIAGLTYQAITKCLANAPKPRLAILTNVIAPSRSSLYEHIATRFETTVLTSGWEANRTTWPAECDTKSFKTKKSTGLTFSRAYQAGGRVYQLRYFHITPGYFIDLVRLRPDAVITTEMGFRSCIALLYGFAFRKPVWVWWGGTIHTEARRTKFKKAYRALFIRVAKAWISYGESSTEYLKCLGVALSQILQIQNCINEEQFSASDIARPGLPRATMFLFVGQLLARKGLEQLLFAISAIQRRGTLAKLSVVGDGPERTRLESLASSLGLEGVTFEGPKTADELFQFYCAADCLVFPTLEDVWGLVVNEALWAQLPVLCSKYAGAAHELLAQENIFDPTNHDEFVDALQRAVDGRVASPDTRRLRTTADVAHAITNALHKELEESASYRL